MSEVTLFGFPRSTYVQIAGLVLTHKDVPYRFLDLESEMGGPSHLALHPFDRVPILRHGDFTLYETAAITSYVDEAFDGRKLTPEEPQKRARMNQWISAINGYYYPYMIYHVSHERNVFPQLGIPSDEKVVAHAMPKVEICLQVMERQAVAREGISAGFGSDPRGFLHAADDPRLRLCAGIAGHVPELPGDLHLARADGSVADGEAVSRRATAARPDRACEKMGRLAPPEILKQRRSKRRMLK